ncbi:MAG: aspartate aminotransferase family protein [Armatimonadetes bacterium]|nr:aspartate aminotransferase family protein [Armatimonadota bacterium]
MDSPERITFTQDVPLTRLGAAGDARSAASQRLAGLARQFFFRNRLDRVDFDAPILARGTGSVVEDVDGRQYLDFNSGQMCAALGHNHPRIVAAIRESAQTLIHASSSLFNVKEIELAARLADLVDRPLQKSFFLSSGSDANEAAITVAKKYTGGYEVASPHVSFHGLSDASRALTFAAWHRGYGPYPAGTCAIVAPYCYRCPLSQTFPKCEFACLKTSFELLDAQSAGAGAAVITEPLYSAGGVIEPPPGWLRELKLMCEARGLLLVLDEAQTGLAKLGSMFAYQREGVVPDILTLSKHFGGGVEISAVVTTPEIEDRVASRGMVFSHSHTSDPMACAAALASLDIITRERLVDRATLIGLYWRQKLDGLAARHEIIGDVRGRGLLQGIELVRDRETKEPFFDAGPRIADRCLNRGLLFSVRRKGSVLRFVPPFTTTESQMEKAAEILDGALSAVESR